MIRILKDLYNLLNAIKIYKPIGLHILGQYRSAIYREFFLIIFAKIFGLKIIYEIKAGVFIDCYEGGNSNYRLCVRNVLKLSEKILCQGKPYVDFLKDEFGYKGIYFPNFIPSSEIPKNIPVRLNTEELKVLFVGALIEGKGIYEIVDAVINVCDDFAKIKLTLAGKVSDNFSGYLKKKNVPKNISIDLLGKLGHEEVLHLYESHDIFCFPSKYFGEGHSNVINEAMMNGMIIISSKAGFLESIIGSERGFLIDPPNSEELSKTLLEIKSNKNAALMKGQRAKEYLLENFTDKVAFDKLTNVYNKL